LYGSWIRGNDVDTSQYRGWKKNVKMGGKAGRVGSSGHKTTHLAKYSVFLLIIDHEEIRPCNWLLKTRTFAMVQA